MDLFSVMIAGSPGTPYEGGLFFFDIRLTPDYPSAPPQVSLRFLFNLFILLNSSKYGCHNPFCL